ncbi:MAG: MFS transporter, partial [Sellimonas sp.]|nr:MFS transporter [Sellimonas sp.]
MKEKLFTRNFTLLILGQVSSLIGNYSLKFALSMYILEQTGSASVFAGITAVSMLPMILFSPFGGILADRADRRNIMVALDMLSGLCVLSASFLLPSVKSLTVIGLLLVILSVLGAFESPTVQACVPQMLAGDNILKGNAIVSQVQAVASLIAPFSGSIFY